MPSSLQTASASGKIILSGEYAVLFGKRGIGVPSDLRINCTFTASQKNSASTIEWNEENVNDQWRGYAQKIADSIHPWSGTGTFVIQNQLPLGKGMGSSTALIVAMCRAALGPECGKIALAIENELNPGNSGIDFAVIWEEKPILFQHDKIPEIIDLDLSMLKSCELIDTGTPDQTTAELVAWVREQYKSPAAGTSRPGLKIQDAIESIGDCTERLLQSESLRTVMRDHHRAQVMLGVVPRQVQAVIAGIEAKGGSAKVIGAGGRTGGGGMVLVLPVR